MFFGKTLVDGAREVAYRHPLFLDFVEHVDDLGIGIAGKQVRDRRGPGEPVIASDPMLPVPAVTDRLAGHDHRLRIPDVIILAFKRLPATVQESLCGRRMLHTNVRDIVVSEQGMVGHARENELRSLAAEGALIARPNRIAVDLAGNLDRWLAVRAAAA